MLNSSSRNVLFIAVDDLRPNLGAYGHSFMHTPRMDELADSGTLFQRAYAQYAFCAPSRNSFMTGRRPDVTRAYSFMNHFRESDVGRNWLSFPQYFRAAGYWAAGAGKLYHPGLPPNFDAADASGRKLSWDTFVWGGECCGNTNGWPLLQPHVTNVVCLPAVDSCGKKEGRGGESESEQIVYGADGAAELWCVQDESKLKAPLVDHVTVDATVAHLRAAAARPAVPFFVAAGLKKPHLPFYYPAERRVQKAGLVPEGWIDTRAGLGAGWLAIIAWALTPMDALTEPASRRRWRCSVRP